MFHQRIAYATQIWRPKSDNRRWKTRKTNRITTAYPHTVTRKSSRKFEKYWGDHTQNEHITLNPDYLPSISSPLNVNRITYQVKVLNICTKMYSTKQDRHVKTKDQADCSKQNKNTQVKNNLELVTVFVPLDDNLSPFIWCTLEVGRNKCLRWAQSAQGRGQLLLTNTSPQPIAWLWRLVSTELKTRRLIVLGALGAQRHIIETVMYVTRQ